LDNLFSQAAPLLMFLLPGFVSAWVLYGLSSHPKPSQFERTVEALVFTSVIHAGTALVELTLCSIGSAVAIAPWTTSSQAIWATLLAVALGVAMASAVNKDTVHAWLRKKGFTHRTSHPSEWFIVLRNNPAYVVLQLHDGRRLTGWPTEWPATPGTGQFYLQEAAWIQQDGSSFDLPSLDGILMPASDVRWVEVFTEEAGDNE
jgi:hypothetical protein